MIDAPRLGLDSAGVLTIEMPRNERKSFRCAATVAVGCPFCMTMLTDASQADGGSVQVKDVAGIVAERLQ